MCKRIASAMLVCAASIALPCFSQSQVEFNTTTTATSFTGGRNLYSIDVNNDGKPDLIRTSGGLLTTSKSLNTSIALGAGQHRFGVFAVNTAGTKWETAVYATVN